MVLWMSTVVRPENITQRVGVINRKLEGRLETEVSTVTTDRRLAGTGVCFGNGCRHVHPVDIDGRRGCQVAQVNIGDTVAAQCGIQRRSSMKNNHRAIIADMGIGRT